MRATEQPEPAQAERTARRVAVIGDVGRHLEELRTELRRLGADTETGHLPSDLSIIQVGDLVHRGPASEGVLALVDGYLNQQSTQWVQLVGNHEAHYLRDPVFDWPERLSPRSRNTLRRWWAAGQMRVAAWMRDDAEAS
jgi:Calcineurin-like phosphoesterase